MPTALFTQENAAEMGLRSVVARRLNPPVYKPRLAKMPPDERVKVAVQRQLSLVSEQITRTRMVLNSKNCEHCKRGPVEPHHRAQLLRSLDCLLDRQRKLLGIPDPANAKVEPRTKGRLSPDLPV